MNSNNSTLKQILVHDFPLGFVREIRERFERVYPDAYEAVYQNADFGEDEAEYMLGHHRRSLAEVALREIAVKYSLFMRAERPKKGGCKFGVASSGRIDFTTCHVSTCNGFPKHSDTREQYSLVNEHASQINLFPVQSQPKKSELYAILIHSEVPGDKRKIGSLCIGFPNSEFKKWVEEPIDLQEIGDIQKITFQKATDLQSQIQRPVPHLKENIKSKTDKDKN